jgi:carboxysome peptide B
MDIFQVVGTTVCTCRHPGIDHLPLRILQDRKGKLQVAVDTIGSRKGNWVFTISGSAARLALDDPSILTDLTIGGVIDSWEE